MKGPINNSPQLVEQLAESRVQKIAPGEGFLASLTSSGEVSYINEDLSVSKLFAKHPINDVVSLENKIYGLANEGLILYEWKPWLQDRTTNRFSEDYATRIYRIHDKKVKYKAFCDLPAAGGTTALYYQDKDGRDNSPEAKLTPPRLVLYDSSSVSSESKEDVEESKAKIQWTDKMSEERAVDPENDSNAPASCDFDVLIGENSPNSKQAPSECIGIFLTITSMQSTITFLH